MTTERLYAHKFHGNPVRIMLLKKSDNEKIKATSKIEEMLLSIKLPTINIGTEKNRDKKSGINISANGIKNLKELSNVNE